MTGFAKRAWSLLSDIPVFLVSSEQVKNKSTARSASSKIYTPKTGVEPWLPQPLFSQILAAVEGDPVEREFNRAYKLLFVGRMTSGNRLGLRSALLENMWDQMLVIAAAHDMALHQ